MAVPDPPAGPHKLIACRNRFAHQIGRATNYLHAALPVLTKGGREQNENLEFALETIVLMLHSFVEEYYDSLVSLATFLNPQEIRAYMSEQNPGYDYQSLPAMELGRIVSQQFSFNSKNFHNFSGIFKKLFGIDPFPDGDSESMIRDLAALRQIITHQGGWPEGKDFKALNRPGIIVNIALLENQYAFYTLQINESFIMGVVKVLMRIISHIEAAISQNPKYAT